MSISTEQVLEALRPIDDPDLGQSIVDLGFVKNVVCKSGKVSFDLELTTPACPVRFELKAACESALSDLAGVEQVSVTLTADTRGAPTQQRQVLKGVRNILAVASGKGGVAKSTTAVNIALALAETGARVGILDADIYGPSVPTMLSVEREPAMAADKSLIPAEAHGIKMISMGFFVPTDKAAILRGPIVSGYISQFLANVQWGELDYLVIDYPPGTGDIQLTLSQQAPITGAVVTTTPQEISLIDVKKAMVMFDTTRIPVLGVIETMSYFVCDQCDKRHEIFRSGGGRRVADGLGVPFLGEVPIDPRVAAAGDQGAPIVISAPESPASVAYTELAGALAAQLAVLNIERGSYLESFSLKWDRN
ncbi:MAG: Mrp/NBP35 family ATP-binding protein [Deltaproteobacteria bacterium]|nr:Mrp/NBP35 family ATP-binding protein [Deltaproteobacteria bacterium]